MKLLFAVALAALLSPCLSASASPVAPSPLLGNWAVDVARLDRAPQDRPKAVTLRFSEAGKGKWSRSTLPNRAAAPCMPKASPRSMAAPRR
ncbi:hypothetical protein [uncultured Xanthomonas sp.]|uniref:hypothetical protein n=1 Tax=uncultured Xanthomonas sp. TaxID=152831 RepID=UPI0025E47A6B|nr:hypothetical protein [uncultured Xanthomonas sp.]